MDRAPHIIIEPNANRLHNTVAQHLQTLVEQAAAEGRAFTLALAGGSTPRGLYQCLAAPPFDRLIAWQTVKIFFGDERTVAPDHPDSNYRMAKEALLDKVAIAPDRIYRMQGDHIDPVQSARDYAEHVEREVAKHDDGWPCFDLVLLGLGPDGHIASLFPNTAILDVEDQTVAAVHVPQHDTWRISLTYPVVNHAKHLWLLATGESKANIAAQILDPANTNRYPAQRLAPLGEYRWYLDVASASQIALQEQ